MFKKLSVFIDGSVRVPVENGQLSSSLPGIQNALGLPHALILWSITGKLAAPFDSIEKLKNLLNKDQVSGQEVLTAINEAQRIEAHIGFAPSGAISVMINPYDKGKASKQPLYAILTSFNLLEGSLLYLHASLQGRLRP